MSDCSTEAMRPKDRRTCGNCANGSTICDGVSARLLERMDGLGVSLDD